MNYIDSLTFHSEAQANKTRFVRRTLSAPVTAGYQKVLTEK